VIRPDARLNAVVVRDAIEKMPLYEELIRALDQPVPMVEIEATVVDISSERAKALGTDFALALSNRPANLSQPVIGLQQSTFNAGVTPRATVLLGNDRAYFFAQINAMQTEGDASVQSKPRVLTMDNNEAVLSSTQEFFVRVPGRDVADLFNVSVGLTLRVTPSIVVEGDTVRFKLQVRIDDGAVSSASVDGVPLVSRTAISAQVEIAEGESLFIGGLTSEVNSNGVRGVPGISKVPVLGWLFGTKTEQTRKVERLFLLTPRLVKGVDPS
jgi:type III secretion protein C